MPKKKTTEEFIRDARAIHGDKYDYSEVVYKGVYVPVTIKCPIHGSFQKRPYDHLTLKQGCKKCSNEKQADRLRKGVDFFLETARQVHGDKYDYSWIDYEDQTTKVKIYCPKHGFFEQAPFVHISGAGCPKCGRETTAERQRGSTELFVNRAIKKYGEKYDYSSISYQDSRSKVEIICKRHGPFWLLPHEHLNGQECPACLRNKKFIERAQSVHGDKYDYSKVEYIDNESPVIISCPIHGDFKQRPHAHLRGRGCPLCGVESRTALKRGTTESFISEARMVHGDEYDYSRVKYVNCDEPVEIICKTHGVFMQSPYSHTKMAQGCPKCAAIRRGEDSRNNTEQFIREATIAHGGKYDYSLVKYTLATNKVKIICPVHGVFEQIARDHLRGVGCKKCYADSKRYTLPELIDKFNQIHHGKYSYDKVEYKNIRIKITVTCPTHGDFRIRPDQHMDGYGCRECSIKANESHLEREVREALDRNHFHYIQEKDFPWLRYKHQLNLDFYLPQYNVAIECQGAQHFYPSEFFGGESAYKENQKRDAIKEKLCRENGITVLYYSDLGIEYPYMVTEDLDVLIKRIENIGVAEHPVWLPDPELPLVYE